MHPLIIYISEGVIGYARGCLPNVIFISSQHLESIFLT